MSFVIDFLLLAASGAACFYCWILSRRLRALTSTKAGIKTGIAALSRSTEDIQSAISESKKAAELNAEQLSSLINESEKKIPELESLLNQLSQVGVQAVNDTEAAVNKLVEVLSPHINEAKESAAMLAESLNFDESDAAAPDTVEDIEHEAEVEASASTEQKKIDEEVVFVNVNHEPEIEGKVA